MEQKKILHFEDEEILATLYKKKLESAGFLYQGYTNPPQEEKDLIELVLKEKPDLILMDIVMPVMDGYTATKKLQADPRTRPVPIVGLSNLSSDDDIEMGLNLGMKEFYTKAELAPSDLVDKIKKILNMAY